MVLVVFDITIAASIPCREDADEMAFSTARTIIASLDLYARFAFSVRPLLLLYCAQLILRSSSTNCVDFLIISEFVTSSISRAQLIS